ncbi:FAD-dependent oxidoreductase [Frondihabitans australicus]|uniref:FAD-dependent oxidoreductase n=1 Tax=Frondihabitans australicus TaxID=386892 RepID=UPI001B85BC18|nr:FAD-dependent oxidoreductase [Frondihabitans australicus]
MAPTPPEVSDPEPSGPEPTLSGSSALELTRRPWSLGSLRLSHRVVVGSMHTGLEVKDDGGAALARFYQERVEGGADLVITGGLAVNSEGRGGEDYAVLGQEADDARFRRAVAAVHEAGGAISAQLFHAGRYALTAGLTKPDGSPERSVAPSPVPWRAARGVVPVELTDEGVRRTIGDFASAAARAQELGFDAVEVMASEGYLVNQFCSPITNQRDDEWGGDAARRRRFPLEVLRAVRAAVGPAFPVSFRVSGDDLMPGSSTPDEVDALVTALVEAGVDGISVGVGWHESTVPTVQAAVPHGVWVPIAERLAGVVRATTRPEVAVIASNRLTDLRDVEDILSRGTVDAVALARPFLADPAIVAKSTSGRFDLVTTCIGCNQACIDRSIFGKPVSCLVNPRAARELEFPLVPSRRILRTAVVGAGPAGLSAALDLARRGNDVTVFEARENLGGQFDLAASIPGKEDYAGPVRSISAELELLGASIVTGTRVGAQELAAYDHVVVATGVSPRVLDLPGIDLPHVLSYEQALRGGVPDGTVAIIGAGGIGVDTAAFLVESGHEATRASQFVASVGLPSSATDASSAPQRRDATRPHPVRPGSQVTLVSRSGKFGSGLGVTSRWVAVGRLREAGVNFVGGVSYRSIRPGFLDVADESGDLVSLPADVVVVCAGQEPVAGLAASLAAAGIPHTVVGGALDARAVDAVRATTEGLEASRRVAP